MTGAGGRNLHVLRPPNSCMIYLGRSNWPEEKKNQKAHKYRVTENVSRDLTGALSYHLSRRERPPFVKHRSLALLYLKTWKTGTDLELEINNLLHSCRYLLDLKCCANEALWDFSTTSPLGDGDVCMWAIRSRWRDCRIARGLWAPGKGTDDMR